ncbi:MAG: hypothetical protein ACTS4Y_01540 [Candidatus Hodgkinia cicadicola]
MIPFVNHDVHFVNCRNEHEAMLINIAEVICEVQTESMKSKPNLDENGQINPNKVKERLINADECVFPSLVCNPQTVIINLKASNV